MHCRKRNEETEVLRKMHRNWYLDRGLVFDLRAPNEIGERWDYTRRADRRLAWREMSKEEPLLVVLGESLSKRGEGEHRRFCRRIRQEQVDKGCYYVQQVKDGASQSEYNTVRGRSGSWTSNSTCIRRELAERRRCSDTNEETDLTTYVNVSNPCSTFLRFFF